MHQSSKGLLELGKRFTKAQMNVWLDNVIPLMFDADEAIQNKAIEVVGEQLPLILTSNLHEHPAWERLRSNILNTYTQEITTQFNAHNSKWSLLWSHCVRLLDIDIPKSATTLNTFLSTVEPALRSSLPIHRAEGYYCWRVLLEVLVKHNRLNSEKRLKLVCTPLKALQARTLDIAVNKFHAWWYVLCNVSAELTGFDSMVLDPFLQFCFGPIMCEPKLLTADLGKRFAEVSLMAAAALARLLGPIPGECFEKVNIYSPDEAAFTDISFERKAKAFTNACGQATMLINRIDEPGRKDVAHSIVEQLWTNLLRRIGSENDFDLFLLVLDNFEQLIETDKVRLVI